MADRKTNLEGMSSRKLVGTSVSNPDGEHLGTVEDMLVSLNDGLVITFILLTRDEDGNDKRIAVPWDMIDVRSNGEIFLGIRNEFLQRIPEYTGQV